VLQPHRSDYPLASAILAMIAAAFSAGLGSSGLYQYIYWFSTAPPQVIGFLIYGIVNVITSAFAIAAAAFMLKRRFIIFSMFGAVISLISAVVTIIIIYQNDLFDPLAILGFMDTLLLSEVSMSIFAILSSILLFKSRVEFASHD